MNLEATFSISSFFTSHSSQGSFICPGEDFLPFAFGLIPAMQKCDVCGSEGVNIRKVTRTYGKGEDLLVIENIPVISCSHCGESYLTAET